MRALVWLLAVVVPALPVLHWDDDPPPEVARFVPAGFETLDFAMGDLDGDGREDAVLILRRTDEEQSRDGDVPRPLLLLIRQADGRLKQVRRTDRLVYCRACGGMLGDPYSGLKVAGRRFTVSFAGGSASSHWVVDFTFAYDAAANDWLLAEEKNGGDERVEDAGANERGGDERATWTETFNRQQLGDVPLESFDYEAREKPRDWRVRSDRAYFYDRPDLESPPRSAYVVRGDRVEGFRELRYFVEARFAGARGRSTHGYLLKKDLEPAPATLPK